MFQTQILYIKTYPDRFQNFVQMTVQHIFWNNQMKEKAGIGHVLRYKEWWNLFAGLDMYLDMIQYLSSIISI